MPTASELFNAMALVPVMLIAGGAQAQTNACDQLKGVLAERIDASGARGYTLEAVPAGTPVPPGATAIGTCEAGKYRILYRRWGATQPSPGAASAAAPAVAVPAAEPDKTPVSAASAVEAAPATASAVAQAAPLQPEKNVVAKAPLVQRATEFMAENWRWILALALLPVAGWIWAWRAHRNAYDEAGLPRGPKL